MSNSKATAMVFEKVGQPFSLTSFDFPKLNTGEILVRVVYATICTSDLHTFYGRRCSHTHSILGHEIIGSIIEIPKNGINDFYGDALKVGDKITWSVYAHNCNDELAKRGMPQKSKDLFKYGHEKINETYKLNGGFATHCHLKRGSTIFKIPKNLTPKEATPLNCTHATIAGAIRLAGDLKGKNVLVSGVGMLGLSACAMAKESGANVVFAMDVEEKRLQQSKRFGADLSLNAKEHLEVSLKIAKEFGGIDVIIETSGVPSAVENGIKMLNIGGICVLIGSVYSQRDISINAETIVRNLLTIKGLHNYIHEDLAKAIVFLSKNNTKYPFEDLVGKEFPIEQLDIAFDFADKQSCYRVGVQPNNIIS
ncbi:zinc-binding dehydrogenase [uncultured Polaribacter sp.]|uniref:zinc-binding dehydrogenase n=1 Tax=uncultured Polaribacter sp. TaxID=174711 RepID=UPI0026214174|nr:zinc-binding dehydrogenase [uncultured Polaribacter sp.]